MASDKMTNNPSNDAYAENYLLQVNLASDTADSALDDDDDDKNDNERDDEATEDYRVGDDRSDDSQPDEFYVSGYKNTSRQGSVGFQSTESLKTDTTEAIIELRVSGKTFCISRSSLLKFPQTRLGQLALRDQGFPGHNKTSYFFDRNPKLMSCVLDLYRTGELHLPKSMCGVSCYRELRFWGIDDRLISECCWKRYKGALQDVIVVDELCEVLGQDEYTLDSWKTWVWLTMEKPGFNMASWIWFSVYLSFVAMTVVLVALATVRELRVDLDGHKLPSSREHDSVLDELVNSKLSTPLAVIDFCNLLFFTLEPTVRLFVTPDLRHHMTHALTWMDWMLALCHWVCLTMELDEDWNNDETYKIIHSIFRGFLNLRVLRIFHVVRKYAKMKVILLTFRASAAELLLLFLGLFMAIILFAAMIYYAEMTQEEDTFANIPEGIWWAVITMTTVGYGDRYPTSVLGYIVGILCALSGVLLLSMPIAITSSNFKTYYSCLVAREQRVRRARYLAEGFSTRLNPLLFPDSGHALARGMAKMSLANGRPSVIVDRGTPEVPRENSKAYRSSLNFSQILEPFDRRDTRASLSVGRLYSMDQRGSTAQSTRDVNEKVQYYSELMHSSQYLSPPPNGISAWFRSNGNLSEVDNESCSQYFHNNSAKSDTLVRSQSSSEVVESRMLSSESPLRFDTKKNYESIQSVHSPNDTTDHFLRKPDQARARTVRKRSLDSSTLPSPDQLGKRQFLTKKSASTSFYDGRRKLKRRGDYIPVGTDTQNLKGEGVSENILDPKAQKKKYEQRHRKSETNSSIEFHEEADSTVNKSIPKPKYRLQEGIRSDVLTYEPTSFGSAPFLPTSDESDAFQSYPNHSDDEGVFSKSSKSNSNRKSRKKPKSQSKEHLFTDYD